MSSPRRSSGRHPIGATAAEKTGSRPALTCDNISRATRPLRGMLGELMTDPLYLATADPSRLLRAMDISGGLL